MVEPEVIAHRARLHRLERGTGVVAPYALYVGVRDHRHRVISDHAVGLVRGELPDGKQPPLLVLGEEGLDEIHRSVPLDDREEWMLGPVGVPEGEDRVVIESLRPVRLEVTAEVGAVDIHEEVRGEHRVVERGVEDGAPIRASAIDTYLSQSPVPFVARRVARRLEIPAVRLGIEIPSRPLAAHCGEGDLDRQPPGPQRLVAHEGLDVGARRFAYPFQRIAARRHAERTEGLREPRDEIEALVLRPGARMPVPLYLGIADESYARIDHPVPVGEIDDHILPFALGIMVPMDTDAFRRGELHEHAVIVEEDAVVSGGGSFLQVVEA